MSIQIAYTICNGEKLFGEPTNTAVEFCAKVYNEKDQLLSDQFFLWTIMDLMLAGF